jgi:hypothetical protein
VELKRESLNEFRSSVMALSKASLPLPVAIRLSKAIEFANREFKLLEETRLKRVRDLGTKTTENGEEIYRILPGTPELDQYVKEMEVVLNETVSLDFEPIQVGELANVSLSALDAGVLLRFGVIV